MTGQVVELAGPAGAGKTTLARALLAGSPRVVLGVAVTRRQLVCGLARAMPSLTAARFSAPGRWWTADELRSVAYLTAWRAPVARTHGVDVVFDHGPAFRLAGLAAHGPRMTRTPAFQRLWRRLAEDWGALLDVVVWLDAPDDVLLRRIDERGRQHRVRGLAQGTARDFLDLYRAAYDKALALLERDGVRVVRFDTSEHTEQQLLAAVTAALDVAALR